MIIDLVQGSPEWLAARVGSLGASSIHEVVARTKSGYSASRANRLATLVVERLTGQSEPTYISAAMQHGTDTEPEARRAYAFMHDADVIETGLATHPTIKGTHASPDGLVGDKGLLEIKCPMNAAHLAVWRGEPIPDKYVLQMLWQMRCCERDWCDFASYNAAFPAHLQLWTKRIQFDAERVAELEREVIGFLGEVEKTVAALEKRDAAAA